MRFIARTLPAVLVALAAVGAFAGCGGGMSEQDVESLLDRAFSQSVESADVKVEAQLQIDGLQGLERPVRLEASGIYITSKDTIPELDIDLTFGAQDSGQTVESGFLSTGERAFLKFGGEFYEQPKKDIARANRELRKSEDDGDGGGLAELGLDPRAWVSEARSEGGDGVAGVETEHVSAKLDTRAVFEDFNEFVERSGNAVGGVTPGTPRPLTEAQLDQLEDVVEDPTFDVHVGKDDDVIRRISASLSFTVPEADREGLSGIEGGTLRFSVELSDVGGDQAVEAPAKSRPIEDLSTQLGGFDALQGEGLEGGAPTPDPGSTETAPGPDATDEPAPDTDALKKYSDCLDQASPQDTAELERCAILLPGRR